MIAITINKISTPCISPHPLLSIFSFLWENVKPYTKGTIFVSPPFIMAKGVIHMLEVDEVFSISEVIEHYDILSTSINQILQGLSSMRNASDVLNGIEKDQRLPVQILYKEYKRLTDEKAYLLGQTIKIMK
jgi:hypothetical protein